MSGLPPQIFSLRPFLDAYDAIICDVWGVLHNGIIATEGAAEGLIAARNAGKIVILLTNAPRPPDSVAEQLAGFGIGRETYDAILSSGGVARDLLAKDGAGIFYHLGPERDAPIFAGLSARPGAFEDATQILCTGLFEDTVEQAEDYLDFLTRALKRGLPMICANPDLVVERGTTLLPCAGALAQLYESLGGAVIWVGKPHPLVYAKALETLRSLAKHEIAETRVLCIGDAFRTDIAGAAAAKLDSLMVLSGIHGAEIALEGDKFDPALFTTLAAHYALTPTAIAASLRW
jgi:HAD superfamily hydrolase (TIGR01459 family)